jgi:hypothetical protein
MGLKKGQTNNPLGRPVGARNKTPEALRQKIAAFIEEDFDNYVAILQSLDPRDRIKAETELIRLIVPRPVDSAELDAIRQHGSPLIDRLFLKNVYND